MIIYYSTNISVDHIHLEQDEHIHCIKVTRHKVGDTIHITDGEGHLFVGEIIDINKKETIAKIIKSEYQEPLPFHLAIAIAPTKNMSRLEWFVEKAIEIGVSEIFPITAKRSERKNINQKRLEKIAVSAMKQSKNLHLPVIHDLATLESVCAETKHYNHNYVAHCDDVKQHLSTFSLHKHNHIIIYIGPEGDFTSGEVDMMANHGIQEVNLGKSRLRTETAGIVAVSIINTVLI